MRTLVPRRNRCRQLAGAITLIVLALHPGTSPAQAPNEPDDPIVLPPILPPYYFGGVHLQVENITAPSAEPHQLVVTYHTNTPIDLGSIDSRDIWVTSRNGYNALAQLVEAAELPDPHHGDAEGAPEGAGDGVIIPFPFHSVRATYAIKPGTGDAWSEEDNGRYAVLLQPHEVRKADGSAFAAELLGDFHVRIGEPVPAHPLDADVSIRREPVPNTAGEEGVVYVIPIPTSVEP